MVNSVRLAAAVIGALLLMASASVASGIKDGAKLIRVRGEVKIRHGMDETWQRARINQLLQDVDTILALEDSEAVLELRDGTRFTLGANSVMDVSDLRKISERELFLLLMSRKVGTLRPSGESGTPDVTNVSVVRAANRSARRPSAPVIDDQAWLREKNGARALFEHDYTASAILKLHATMARSAGARSCAEAHFLLGQAFAELRAVGRARVAFRQVLELGDADTCPGAPDADWADLAERALERLQR